MESLAYVLTSGWASGVNVYVTVLVTGLIGRFGDVAAVPPVLERTEVLVAAALLASVEFVTDKIPYVDNAWDAVHTAIRPTLGAVLAALLAGEGDDLGEAVAAVLGGTTALASHATKASLRLAVNASPEPVSNIVLSLAEDTAVVAVLLFAVDHPWGALAVALVLLAAGVAVGLFLIRTIRRSFDRLLGRRAAEPPRYSSKNVTLRWTWNSLTAPSSTMTSWPSTQTPWMFLRVSFAFATPWRQASSKLSGEVAVSSMILATDTLGPPSRSTGLTGRL